MTVTVDGRPLDIEHMREQGVGRYAQGLIAPLARVAQERGGRLVVLRERGGGGSPFGGIGGARERFLRRPRVPARAVELVEQGLLPIDVMRARPDVHHSLSLYRTPLVSPARVVVTVHDVVPLQHPRRYLRSGLAHRVLYRAVRRAAGIVCVSSAARADLLRHLDVDPERVWVVPEAAGESFRPTDPAGAAGRLGLAGPYLLCVGALDDPRKDVQGLIDAFAAWSAAEGRPETLVLAGPGDPSALRIAGRVKLPGFVAEPDLPALYSGASCFVTASRYEGFGLGALESIACGTPVVAYDAGAIPETAGPGALLAPLGDAAALMRAAGRVCDEPELARRLADEGRRHAGGFSWRRTAELTWDVYERVS